MGFLIEIGLEILCFVGEIYNEFDRNDKYKIKLNRKKVLRFLRKNWDQAFTAEEIKNRVLRKLDKEVVLSILDYLKVVNKVEVIKKARRIRSFYGNIKMMVSGLDFIIE